MKGEAMCDVLCADEPGDLAAVQADEALINGITAPIPVTADDVSRVLYAALQDLDAEPCPVLVTVDEAACLLAELAAVRRGREILAAAAPAVFAALLLIAATPLWGAVAVAAGMWLLMVWAVGR